MANNSRFLSDRVHVDFYSVAEDFLSEADTTSQRDGLLERWIRLYPAYGQDLFALAFSRFQNQPLHSIESADVDDAVVASARKLLGVAEPDSDLRSRLTSLAGEAKAQGISARQLAESCGIDVVVLAKLEQRLIHASTVPQSLAEQFAGILHRTYDEVVAYLRLPPQLAAQAHFKSRTAPSVTHNNLQTFEDAIQDSRLLSRQAKADWLREAASGRLLGLEDPA